MKPIVTKAITAMIGGTACNFNCAYCYRKYHGVTEKKYSASISVLC
jgi:sulfatase maturation enzyme AslB (radical SAM superfamily)